MIMVITEYPNDTDLREGQLFASSGGKYLRKLFYQHGLRLTDANKFYISSVFQTAPEGRKSLHHYCDKKTFAIPGKPALIDRKYVTMKYREDLLALMTKIEQLQPKFILCLGAAASWALFNESAITKLRGYWLPYRNDKWPVDHTCFAFCTHAPQDVMQFPKLAPIFATNINKFITGIIAGEIKFTPREIWIEPTLDDLYQFYNLYIKDSDELSCDIETARHSIITCIGFAPDPSHALVIPLADLRAKDKSYWSVKEEKEVHKFIRMIFATHTVTRGKRGIGQNFMYDAQYIAKFMRINPTLLFDDTMLMAHAHAVELPRSLGFLGSIFAQAELWKFMRAVDQEKEDKS